MIKFNLHKTFKSNADIKISLNAEWEQGNVIAIYGPSGAGKTTLLRMLSGLVEPDDGYLEIDNETWFDAINKINLKVNKRNIACLFQDFALFPNMTVDQNIRFGMDDKADEELVKHIISIADLNPLLNQKPINLSTGQQQRVALARSIARKPKLLLLDEPLSALDNDMRVKLQEGVLELRQVIDTTIVWVSHDLKELLRMADRIVVVENGRFTQSGTPKEIFSELEAETTGEVVASEERAGKKVITVMVDGRLVKIELPLT